MMETNRVGPSTRGARGKAVQISDFGKERRSTGVCACVRAALDMFPAKRCQRRAQHTTSTKGAVFFNAGHFFSGFLSSRRQAQLEKTFLSRYEQKGVSRITFHTVFWSVKFHCLDFRHEQVSLFYSGKSLWGLNKEFSWPCDLLSVTL